jgi:hypothetical protein
MPYGEMVSIMEKQDIINAVVEVVEDQMKLDAPAELTKDQIEAALILGRPSLTETAKKIADKLLG